MEAAGAVGMVYLNEWSCIGDNKITKFIQGSESCLFFREDFKKFGSYGQVGRVLKKIVETEGLI